MVVSAIKHGILVGRFVPGQRLMEADLRREHGLSRGPVREAMTRLAAEGVIAIGAHRGAYIRALTRTEVFNLLQVLKIIIGLAARLAAVRIEYGDNRIKLMAAFQRLEAEIAGADPIMLAIERTRFYDTLFEIAGNPELARINPVVAAQILRVQVYGYLTTAEKLRQYADYRFLCDAILTGDAKAAKRIVDLHLRRSRMHAQHLPDAAFAIPASGTRRSI